MKRLAPAGLFLAAALAACASAGVPSGGLPAEESPHVIGGGTVLRRRGLFFESGSLPAGAMAPGPYVFEFDTDAPLDQVDITLLDGEGRVAAPGFDKGITRVRVVGGGRDEWSREEDGTRVTLPLGGVAGRFRIVVDAQFDGDALRFAMVFRHGTGGK